MTAYDTLARQYQTAVISGAQPVCRWVQLACARNARDLARQDTVAFPFHFDAELGGRICQAAEMLPHIKGPKAFVIGQDDEQRAIWNPIVLEPWQCWILTTIFGWRRADGTRRFRVAFTLIPRKNAKSSLAAIVALYMLTADGEGGAEVYSAATTRDQAKVVAEIAWEMARRSPAFREFYGVRIGSKTTRTLDVPASASKFMPLSADAHSLDGLNVSFAAIDELHAHKTRAVWDVLDTATGARRQPLLFPISTAGVEIGGICHEKLQYLEKVLDGVVDDESFFGVNYTIDPGDDVRDPAIQRKANPNYDVSVQPDDLARKIHEAESSPAAWNNVLTKHFNVWIRTESAWMGATLWQQGAQPSRRIEDYRAHPCWIGIDLAETRDIAAVIALFQMAPDRYAVFGRYYLPEETIAKSPVAQMSGWVRDGYLIATPGNQADYRRIQADVVAWCAQFQVREIDFDRALAAHMAQDLKAQFEAERGRDAAERFVVTVDQTVQTMDPAMKMVERLVLAQQLEHDGNPVLAWMISNVVIERNYKDEIYPRKAGGKDSPNKIDGAVALFTGMARAMVVGPPPPVYQLLVVGGGEGPPPEPGMWR